MGVDWIRRSEERYKHQLQDAAYKNLKPTPLFDAEDEAVVTYPCRWLHEDYVLPVGTRLTIFQRSYKARIAVMEGSRAVGEVLGEAVKDLKELFRTHPEMCNSLAVQITSVGQPSEPFYVTPVSRKKKSKRTIQ